MKGCFDDDYDGNDDDWFLYHTQKESPGTESPCENKADELQSNFNSKNALTLL